jgi:hypothetical protein
VAGGVEGPEPLWAALQEELRAGGAAVVEAMADACFTPQVWGGVWPRSQ